ncbi:MAG: copper chaperone Copz family protein [Acidobacteria bacterium]|nr:copper chaperone Copz family protein [Acidobacteriota bacterium]
MEETCCPAIANRPHIACPRCGAQGRLVSARTVSAHVRADVAARLLGVEQRFCGSRDCPVLYYGSDGRLVEKDASLTRIGAKESTDPIPLCYCFNVTAGDVREEIVRTGRSAIADWIAAEVRAGRCACEVKNPSGVCCLGDVRRCAQASQRNPGPAARARDLDAGLEREESESS